MPGLKRFYYRLVTIDGAGDVSEAFEPITATAFDDSAPVPPQWLAVGAGGSPGADFLSWIAADAALTCLVQRRPSGADEWKDLSQWLLPRPLRRRRSTSAAGALDYRLLVTDVRGRTNRTFNLVTF